MSKTDDDSDVPVWGAAAIAKVLNTTTRKAFHLLEERRVDASKIGTQWVSTRRRLLRQISGGER
jgi:hypothetical protein